MMPTLTNANSMLNGDFMTVLLSVMLVAAALYGLYTAIRLRVSCMLFPNKFLFPANCKIEDCLDEDGFIDYMTPRLMAWSIAMLVVGVAYVLNSFVFHFGGYTVELVSIFVPVVVIAWLMVMQRTAAKRFWGV